MFPLRDRTRRWICRTFFLAVGVTPTLSLIGWCMAMTSPSHVAVVREQIAAALGVELRFEKLSHPRPGTTLFEQVQLADPETGESLAHIGQLEMRLNAPQTTWSISEAEINADQTDWLVRLVQQCLQLGAIPVESPGRIAVSELRLHWSNGSQSFIDGNVEFTAAEQSRSLAAVLRPVNSAAATPIQIHAQRSLDASGTPRTTVQIDTAECPSPCSLLSTLAKMENHFGNLCKWQGALKLAETACGWRTECKGQLKEVDLHAMVSDHFPQQLNGRAEIDIGHMFAENGRLESCDATVRARDGSIGGEMIRKLGILNMQPVPIQPPFDRLITFGELHFDFSLDASGLVVTGRCGKAESRIVMRDQTGWLVVSTSSARVGPASLVNVLIPAENQQVIPATEQAYWLLRVLPLPGAK